uniref:bifunctional UDP-N-acetylglucosamine diphosphorylase/glucosamine-1-phosphate N-acetyltransferase GlmU n=1 Tax=Sutterella wadsworthensis TaxID=40545 RepID=UPI003A8EC7D1
KRMHSRLPKVLQPLAGRPILDHVLDATEGFSESPRVVVVGHCADEVQARYSGRNDLVFALQQPQLGTGHALQTACPHLNGDDPHTFVCLGDVPLLSRKTIAAMREECGMNDLVLLTVKLDNPKGYGRIVRDEFGRVTAIVEEKDATAEQKLIREINTGIMVLPTAKLADWLSALTNTNAQGEYYLTDVIGLAARAGARIATVHPEHVYEVEGVNSKRQLAQLERTWQLAQAYALLDAGVTLVDPARIDVRGELVCSQDVEIDVNCVFEGKVILEEGVRVGANCVIKDAVVRAHTEVLPFCHIDGADIGCASQIGPYSRLRPGAELAGHNHIGNFVEVKKSTVGVETKINHLTYVGDAAVGARVNIGAGSITCNYDCVNRHRTVIGDDAFIGSGTELVAPVTVGNGATIGAGTTLTRTAPEGKLTVGRARQVTIEAWQRPKKN